MMSEEDAAAVRAACADGARTCHDVTDALMAVAMASKLILDAIDKIEQSLLDINGLAD
jgi:hypothetical protein